MRPFIYFLALFLLLPFFGEAQYASLYVQNPQSFYSGQGTVEEATIAIHPKGTYTENSLYLTFSARDNGFTSADSLEVTCYFQLPDGAIVTDLWLWINDTTIMKALIIDRWTASSIYESIVRRRRDPAILYKEYSNYYQLRIYPLVGTGTRKIKLTYLAKNNPAAKSILSPLPTHLIRASKYPIDNVSLRFWPSGNWTNPLLLEHPEILGVLQHDPIAGDFTEFTIPGTLVQSSLSISYDSPIQNNISVQRYEKNGEGYYQLAFIPSRVLNLNTARKAAILFDYDPTKSTVTAAEILTTVKSALRNNFTAADSFNLLFSQVNIRRVGGGWFAGDSAGIQAAFDSAGTNPISNYSNLPTLLASGIDFIQSHGDTGIIWLIANTDQFGEPLAANPLISDLLNLMPKPIPVHITDFNDVNVQYHWISSQTYYGNQYFFENLARLTKGSNQRINYNQAFSDVLFSTEQLLRGSIETFDLYTTLSSGFCYGRFTVGIASVQTVSLDKPIIHVGMYRGAFPLVVEISGSYQDSLFSRRFTIEDGAVTLVDSVLRQVWAAQYLQSLENQTATSEIIRDIIDLSIHERILSTYTAFLALEPNDTLKACSTCPNESQGNNGGTIHVEQPKPNQQLSDSLIQIYPNPSNAQMNIRVRLPNGITNQGVTLRIFNTLGQLVYTFDASKLDDRHVEQMTWRCQTNNNVAVATGIYFLVLNTPKGRFATKLLVMK